MLKVRFGHQQVVLGGRTSFLSPAIQSLAGKFKRSIWSPPFRPKFRSVRPWRPTFIMFILITWSFDRHTVTMRSLSAAKVHFDSDRLGGKRSTRSPTILPPIHTLAANEDRLDRQFEPWLIRCTRRQTSKVDRRQFDPWTLGGKSDPVRASNRRIFGGGKSALWSVVANNSILGG